MKWQLGNGTSGRLMKGQLGSATSGLHIKEQLGSGTPKRYRRAVIAGSDKHLYYENLLLADSMFTKIYLHSLLIF